MDVTAVCRLYSLLSFFVCFCTDLFGKVNCWVKLSALTINGAGQTKGCNFIILQMRLERFALSLLPLPSGQRQEEMLPFGWCLLVPCPRRSGRSPRRSTTEPVGPRRPSLLCYNFSAILFRNAERGGKCCALWVFRSDQAGGEEEQAARCRLPVVHPHLSAFLCFPTPPCLSLTSRQSYSMACSFHPVSGHAVVAQESLCLAGVLYLNAVKSIMAAAYV